MEDVYSSITDDVVSLLFFDDEEEKKGCRSQNLSLSRSRVLLLLLLLFCVFVCAYTYILIYISREKETKTRTHIYKSLETTSYYYASRRVRTTLLSHIIIEKVDKKTRRNDVEHSTTDFSNDAQR